jgi:hypothetical protein
VTVRIGGTGNFAALRPHEPSAISVHRRIERSSERQIERLKVAFRNAMSILPLLSKRFIIVVGFGTADILRALKKTSSHH